MRILQSTKYLIKSKKIPRGDLGIFLFDDETSVGLEGELEAGFLPDFEGRESGGTSLVVEVERGELTYRQTHRLEVEGDGEGFLEGIETGDVPLAIGGLAGQDDVFARIAIDEAGLLPGGGQLTQEIHLELWELLEVVGLDGHTLDGGLHDDA